MMQMTNVEYFWGGAGLLFLLLWILFSFWNAQRMEQTVQRYIEEEDYLRANENKYQETSWRTEFFLRRMDLQEKYAGIHALAEEYRKDSKRLKRHLFKQCLKIGFFYNIL